MGRMISEIPPPLEVAEDAPAESTMHLAEDAAVARS